MSDDLTRTLDRLDAALDRIEASAEEIARHGERHERLRGDVAEVLAELDALTREPADG